MRVRMVLSVAALALMAVGADILDEREAIFPEVAALVIILIELTNPKNMFRNRPLPLWLTTIVVGTIGTLSRWLIVETLSLPYILAVGVAFAASLAVMWRSKLMFPPIPALSVIPFILPDSYLLYPLEVALGGSYAIMIPLLAGGLRRRLSKLTYSSQL